MELCLHEALKLNDCPVCHCIKKEFDEYMKWFKIEGYKEPSVCKSIQEAGYICDRHKSILKDMGEYLNNTFDFILPIDLEAFKSPKSIKKMAKHLMCKFCLEEERIEKLSIMQLCKIVASKKGLSIYMNSSANLCKRHLILTIDQLKDSSAAEAILNKYKKRLSQTIEALEAYFNSLDYNSAEKKNKRAFQEALKLY